MSAVSRARPLTRTAIVGALATAGLVLLAVPALAHITVTPGSVQAGSTAVLTFHVPNEESKADTTRVDIQIPTDHPIAQLLVQPVPGWTISVRTVTLAKPLVTDDGQFTQAVSEVIWSGGQIAPGQFQNFSLSADPLPTGVSSVTFKAIQTYSNGDVVRWIDLAQPGQPEPDHPAPVLTLTTGPAAADSTAGSASAAPPAAATSGSDGMARGIAAGGVLIGLLGLALAALSWRRAKAPAQTEPLMPAHNGNGHHDLAMAAVAKPVQEQRGGADRSSQTRPAPEPKSAGTAPRGTPRRKGSGGRRGQR